MANKLRFKVGDRVTLARGFCIQSTGRITGRPGLGANGKPGADWVVRLDTPVTLRSGSVIEEPWMDDDELEPWTVPPEARPLSVGALKGGSR